jgi:hypothetical protein
MKAIAISIFLPVLILAGSVALNLHIASTITVWPLLLLELTGCLGNNPEGFAHKYMDVSMVFSLVVQAVVIYFLIRLVGKNHALRNNT